MSEYTYDISTDVGYVRLLISDVGGTSGKDFLFKDAEIEAALIRKSTPQLAAAQLLLVIASNTAQVLKRIKFLELETDGTVVAEQLRELSKELKEADDEDSCFEIVTMNVDMFSRRKIEENRRLREAGAI